VLEFDWRGLGLDEDRWSSSKVNRLIGEFLGQALPSVDFAHGDLTSGEQRPEQHGCGLGRGQHCLGLDPTFELLVEPFDRVGGTRTLPLADGQPGEGEQPVTDLLKVVGYRFAFEPPFADEGTSAHLDSCS
jgi:hypothetical protein